MFYNLKSGLVRTTNSDGCFLFQFTVLGFEGMNAFDNHLIPMLTKTIEWLQLNPMNMVLKSALLGNILASLVYNPQTTIQFLDENGLSDHFLYEIINNDRMHLHIY